MGSDRGTLLDIAMTQDPKGMPAYVAKVLTQMLPMLKDGPAFPSNNEMGQRNTIQNSLPTVQTAQLNKGTPRSKGGFTQVVDTIAWLDGRSEVDVRQERIKGAEAVAHYRRQQDALFIEALAQAFELIALYGEETLDPGEFTGICKRTNALATAITGSQVRSMGTVVGGDGTSIYIVDWGRDSAHFIYPEKSGSAGLEVQNKGEQMVLDAASNPLEVEVTKFDWRLGLTVKDPRHIARLANIDVSDALLDAPTQGLLMNELNKIFASMPSASGLQRVMYTSRNVEAAWWNQAVNHPSAALQIRDYLGEPMPMYRGYPIRASDRVSEAESTVT